MRTVEHIHKELLNARAEARKWATRVVKLEAERDLELKKLVERCKD